jgi:hypothetical protein
MISPRPGDKGVHVQELVHGKSDSISFTDSRLRGAYSGLPSNTGAPVNFALTTCGGGEEVGVARRRRYSETEIPAAFACWRISYASPSRTLKVSAIMGKTVIPSCPKSAERFLGIGAAQFHCDAVVVMAIHPDLLQLQFRASQSQLASVAAWIAASDETDCPVRAGSLDSLDGGAKEDGSIYLWTDFDPPKPEGIFFGYKGCALPGSHQVFSLTPYRPTCSTMCGTASTACGGTGAGSR